MIPTQRMAGLISVLVLCFSAAVYLLTLTPTVPFWDSGEFIAVAKILGVPHPPGTPFYVLLARIATLVPLGSIAQRVNALSAISAALTIWITYLTALRLIRLAQGPEAQRQPWHEGVAIAAALGASAACVVFIARSWRNALQLRNCSRTVPSSIVISEMRAPSFFTLASRCSNFTGTFASSSSARSSRSATDGSKNHASGLP